MSQIGSSPQVRIQQKKIEIIASRLYITTAFNDCWHKTRCELPETLSKDRENSVQSQGTNEELLEELTGMYLVNGLFHPFLQAGEIYIL